MAITFFNWIKTTLANITAANIADADEFVVIDQDGDGASPPGPASKAITRAELSKALVVQEELPESPISPDNTVSEYVFDVSDYVEAEITADGLGFAAGDVPRFRFSTDNGATYRQGASDYLTGNVGSTDDVQTDTTLISASDDVATSGYNLSIVFTNLRAGRATVHGFTGQGGSARAIFGFANFDGPITHIKLFSDGGNNLNAGTIRAVGIRGSAV